MKNKEVTLLKVGGEKIKKITRITGEIDYFLKVDRTGYIELDWLPITNKELNELAMQKTHSWYAKKELIMTYCCHNFVVINIICF